MNMYGRRKGPAAHMITGEAAGSGPLSYRP